jgi:hypothetical protein
MGWNVTKILSVLNTLYSKHSLIRIVHKSGFAKQKFPPPPQNFKLYYYIQPVNDSLSNVCFYSTFKFLVTHNYVKYNARVNLCTSVKYTMKKCANTAL